MERARTAWHLGFVNLIAKRGAPGIAVRPGLGDDRPKARKDKAKR